MPKWLSWSRFEMPDRALAYLALFVGCALLVQQATEYPHGVIYMLSDTSTRDIIDKSTTYPHVVGVWRDVMTTVYWFFIAGALFSLVALLRGTIRDAKENTNKKNKDIGEINRNISRHMSKLKRKHKDEQHYL